MFEKVLSFFGKVAKDVHTAFNPPQHLRFDAFGASRDECLRNLEKEAGLPKGDLYVKGEPMKVASWPLGLRSLRYGIWSKTSAEWEAEKRGYVSGSLLEPTQKVFEENRYNFMGSLNISKNCPGVFRQRESDYKSVCTTCGYVDY
ncbi:MAG: hypothetical protein M0P64_04175 [Candidatus Pacebacteria bacterium]|jgi:hypothetical protein|nr:hypothetical protein [Candidatus Paceibacterota bacterium]